MRIAAIIVFILATLVARAAAQEPYPSRPISIVGGHAQLWASPPALAAPHLEAGKMRALATWGATRLAAFPGVPTLKELGYDVEYYIWTGLFAPRGVSAGDRDAQRIAAVIQFIGKTEAK